MTPSREAAVPLAGPYTIKFVNKGPEVPCRLMIVREVSAKQDPLERQWTATIAGETQSGTFTGHQLQAILLVNNLDGELFDHIDPPDAAIFIKLMMFGHVISERRYAKLMRDRAHWQRVASWHPSLHPYKRMDLRRMPALGRLQPPPGDEDA